MPLEHADDWCQLGFAARFATGLTDPTCPPPSGVIGPRGKGAVKRYDVYRNNVTVSLINALASIYPAVQRITGSEFFRAMARFHVRTTTPTSPLLFEYGRDFPVFIEGYKYAQDMPWLGDVARIERAWLDAYHAADAPPLPTAALAQVPPDRLGDIIFEAHPTTRIVRSAYPALAIFAMNRADGPVTSLKSSAAEDALVTRTDMDVEVRLLPQGNATFLASLIDGETLAEAASKAFDEASSFDLSASIAGMMEVGVFTTLRLGD